MTTRALAVAAVLSLVAATLVLGEPSRPATATVVRPIVTVQALCTAPTIIDVAAGEPTRALTAVNGLLGVDDPLLLEAARDVSIVETADGTYFVWIRDGELRLAILRPTGLPILAPAPGDGQPPTYRAFELSADLAAQDTAVIPAEGGVYVLFGGEGDAVSAIRLDATTLTSETASLSAARAPDGIEVSGPATRPGAATAHAQVLWVATDDGALWTYDPAVDAADRWVELADGLAAPLLAHDEDLVYGVFDTGPGQIEIRGYATPESSPVVYGVSERDVAVEAASFPASATPGFLVRGAGDATRAGVLTPGRTAAQLVWSEGLHTANPAIGIVANADATAVLTDDGSSFTYEILAADGSHAGSLTRLPDEPDCVTTEGWPDAGALVRPMSAGSLIHLHNPDSQFDCILDTREGISEVDALCAPDGAWSVDKGQAPDSDFTIEIERAIEEFREDQEEEAVDPDESDDPEADPDEPLADDADEPTEPEERLEDEFADIGIGILEVDEDLTEICAAEEVTAVVAPDLDALEPVGDRAIRVDWSWAGGRCLPERYVIDTCMVASDGDGCSEQRSIEVIDSEAGSNRFSYEVSSRPGRSYRVSVTAYKQRISSSASNSLLVTTPPSVPAPPDDVSASLSSNGVWTVSWASCLDDRSCEQRPEGFVVTVEGCDGDSLPRQTHSLGAVERSVSYDISGSGFQGTDLLGKRVRFRVAAVAAGYASDNITANPCTESARPGRNASAGDSSISLGLSGRTTSMTLDGPSRSSALTRLFGTSTYDDVSARLIRSSSSTGTRNGALGGSVSFEVARCELSGWTVELTPRRGGTSLTNHQSRISGVSAACDWSITDATQASATVTGGNVDAITARVSIPGLADDVRTGKVDSVSAEVSCARWNGGTVTPTASGASIDGNNVTFTVTTPAVFDIRGACTIAPRVRGNDGATVVPKKANLDLTPVKDAIVDRVGPGVVSALKEARTGTYRRASTGPPRNRAYVRVQDASGLPCTESAGTSTWEISAGKSRNADCSTSMDFRGDELTNGRADVVYKVRLAGGKEFSVTENTNICAIPDGPSELPCVEVCPWQEGIPASSPDCFEPCPIAGLEGIPASSEDCVAPPGPCQWDPALTEDDPDCVEPPAACEWDPSIPADSPDCVEPPPEEEEPPAPEPCEWDPDLSADDPACVEPVEDPPIEDPPAEEP